jgi:hypothetical protein
MLRRVILRDARHRLKVYSRNCANPISVGPQDRPSDPGGDTVQQQFATYFERRARQELGLALGAVSPAQRSARLAIMREFERRATLAQERPAWP